MIGQTTGTEVTACVSLAVGLFAGSLVPFFLLVDAEHLTPSWLRDPVLRERVLLRLLNARDRARLLAVNGLLVLVRRHTAPKKGATS